MHPLVPDLVSLLFARPERGLETSLRARLERASEAGWGSALYVLGAHKVLPLVAYQLSAFKLDHRVPAGLRSELATLRMQTGTKNLQLFSSAAAILKVANQRNEPQLALKGLILADSYYPDLSTRPMGDIDFVPVPERYEQLFRIVEEVGYRPSETHKIQEDGITYVNAQGLICDAHRRLSMFNGQPWESIVRDHQLTKLRGIHVLTLEPNAMVAHLVVHMGGHLVEIGAVLMWLLDLAFALRRHGAELDAERIRVLCGSDADWSLFLRMVGFLEQMGEEIPAGLRARRRFMPPLSLGYILRQRRIRPWGLPGALGWARLAAQRLELKKYEKKPKVETEDLWLWPMDEAVNALAPTLARWL